MTKPSKDFSAEDLFDGTDVHPTELEDSSLPLSARRHHDGLLPEEERVGYCGLATRQTDQEIAALSRAIAMAVEAGAPKEAELLFDTLSSLCSGRVATPDEIAMMGMLFSASDCGSEGLVDSLWEAYPEFGVAFSAVLFSTRVH